MIINLKIQGSLSVSKYALVDLW